MHTFDRLRSDLQQLKVKAEGTLLVHSSMKKIGEVEGGADTVLDALTAYMSRGLLVFPTLSYNLNAENPVFDVNATPAIVGILPERFRQRPGVVRSLHPTHSVAAIGEGAAAFVAGHETFDSPCAPHSPWGKLWEKQAQILFIGTGIGCNTYLHGIEERAGVPDMLTESRQDLVVVTADQRKIDVPTRRHVGDHSRFYRKIEPLLAGQGAAVYGQFGDAECCLLDAVKTTQIVMALLAADPRYFTHDAIEPQTSH
jgi:aminoglycoside 3-N-acetyltransferase